MLVTRPKAPASNPISRVIDGAKPMLTPRNRYETKYPQVKSTTTRIFVERDTSRGLSDTATAGAEVILLRLTAPVQAGRCRSGWRPGWNSSCA